MIKFNKPLNQYEENTNLLKEGRYLFKILSVTESVSKTSGNNMYTFEVEHARLKFPIKYYLVLGKEYSEARLANIIKYICESNNMDTNKTEFELSDFTNKLIGAHVKPEEYTNSKGESKLKMKVEYFCRISDIETMPVDKVEVPVLDDDDIVRIEDIPFK
jgi:hypothetical protein